ncbi:uncharacterized protein LOC100369782 [Saccoglossus kowalevskii]|uniref:Uncharacterized protein LOC100369782 n=1 Tax=Saccoglossus kowalevskii TaxID=10224 RepID=A0ABM0GUJ7_SACKO|nr:PREDICTED: uncharacterized protein LOC100369782 [Saccoglossus kowalevskii]
MAYVFPPPNFNQQQSPRAQQPQPSTFTHSEGIDSPQWAASSGQRYSSPQQHWQFPPRAFSPASGYQHPRGPNRGNFFPPRFCPRPQGNYPHSHSNGPFRGGCPSGQQHRQHQIFNSQGQWQSNQQQQFGTKGNQGKSNTTTKKKPKKEQILQFYCETCDRGFKTEDKLDEHLTEHVKCEEDGCKFQAHWKVVKLHYQFQHGPGSKKIGSLDTPEEIRNWIEERKRNYPTVINVAKKKQHQMSKEDSGRVLETKQFGKMGRFNRGRQHKNQRYQKGNNFKQNGNCHGNDDGRKSPSKRKSQGATELTEESSLKRLKINAKDCGMKNDRIESVGDPLSSILVEDQDMNVKSPLRKVSVGTLGSLAASYGTSSSDEDYNDDSLQKAKEKFASTSPPDEECWQRQQQQEQEQNRYQRKWKRKPDKKNKQVHNKQNSFENGLINGRKRKPTLLEMNGLINGRKKKPTLLEMLLAGDIRHERNVLLQCVRYVKKKNFFDGEKSVDVHKSDSHNETSRMSCKKQSEKSDNEHDGPKQVCENTCEEDRTRECAMEHKKIGKQNIIFTGNDGHDEDCKEQKTLNNKVTIHRVSGMKSSLEKMYIDEQHVPDEIALNGNQTSVLDRDNNETAQLNSNSLMSVTTTRTQS